jgi:hypothetical protein
MTAPAAVMGRDGRRSLWRAVRSLYKNLPLGATLSGK